MAKRFALIALLALASHAFLPYVHALASGCDAHSAACSSQDQAPRSSHSPDCAVCGAIAQAGARAIDAPSALAIVSDPQSLSIAVPGSLAAAPNAELDVTCARGPPVFPRPA
jgi:hypothetical protein